MPDDAVTKLAEALAVILKGDSPPPETPAASAAPPAPTPPAGDPAPQGLPPAVATGAAEVAAQGGPGLPPGILSLEEIRRQEEAGGSEQRGMTHAEKMEANERFIRSYEHHVKEGSL